MVFHIDLTDPYEAIEQAMHRAGYSYNRDYLDTDEQFSYSVMVDEDNSEASEREIDLWREGRVQLYSANLEFRLYRLEEIRPNMA